MSSLANGGDAEGANRRFATVAENSCRPSLKRLSSKRRKSFFILKINSTTGFDLNERRQKGEPCRSAFAVTLPWMARLANEAAVKGVDRRSRTETANPVGPFIILNKLAFSDSIIKHF